MGIEGKQEWGLALFLLLLLCPLTLFLWPERDEQEKQGDGTQKVASLSSVTSPSMAETSPPQIETAIQLDGWERDTVERYSADKLHEKINGRAGLYLTYDAQELCYVLYKDPNDREVEVYDYTMGSPMDAFGIFSEERPAEAEQAGVGQYSYSEGGIVAYCKDASYVIVLPVVPPEGPVLEIAKTYAEKQGSSASFTLNAMIPKSHRVEGTLAYMKDAPFGIDPLPPIFTARYDLNGTVFHALAADTEELNEELFSQLKAFFEQIGTVQTSDVSNGKILQAEAFDMGFLFLFLPDRLVGAVEVDGDIDSVKAFLLEWSKEVGGGA